MQLINLHTHRINTGENIQIRNVFAQNLLFSIPDFLFTAGLHPWHIGKVNAEICLEALEQAIIQKNMLAVGECGLDRSIGMDFGVQKQYFIKQISLAEKYRKPLIIHCVRAYSDLLNLKKQMNSGIPWIIHGFSGNLIILYSLIKYGFYFSVGERFLRDKSKSDVFRKIPIERLFLETDESETSIEKIYLFAAQILKIEERKLIEAICTNFITLFDDDKLVAKD